MKIGIERAIADPSLTRSFGRFALLSNQASVDVNLTPSWKLLHEHCGSQMVALFGPQHGFESVVQDNMIESSHGTHTPTGLPVFSLYSETREPTEEMLKGIDSIVIDLQISGTRIYTYKYTLAACLRAAVKFGKRVIVLDRPNPLGGVHLEGNVLHLDAKSFVGEFPIPMRHGLTPGEAAQFFNAEIGADLEVVWMEGWNPRHVWGDLGRAWILTSPNLPTPDSVYVYPGTVIFEGTNISEGRGTTRPFQFIGAAPIKKPSLFIEKIINILGHKPEGLFLRPTTFQPTYHKWMGQECGGVDVVVLEPHKVRSFKLALAILRASYEMMGDAFKWAQPPYEYNYKDLPIDLLLGKIGASEFFTASHFSLEDDIWTEGLLSYSESIKPYKFYNRDFQCDIVS